jgi:putative endonuclease
MFSVYILHSQKDNKRYIGYTQNLERRLNENNNGICKSTKNRRPLKLVHTESFKTKSEAMQRERFFKTGKGREFLNTIS